MCFQENSEYNLLVLLPFLLSARSNPLLDKCRWKSSPSRVFCLNQQTLTRNMSLTKGSASSAYALLSLSHGQTTPVHHSDPSGEHKATLSWACSSWGAHTSPAGRAAASFPATTGAVLVLCPAGCCSDLAAMMGRAQLLNGLLSLGTA